MQLYNIPSGGEHTSAENVTDYTAEFLLTRGPYALLGYSWCGCTNGRDMRPRVKEWDHDYPNGAVSTERVRGLVFSSASGPCDCAVGLQRQGGGAEREDYYEVTYM